ncbi:MAG: galactokinase [Ruminococcaceae bacterium]|nr:galactokinase [Oscillospiraceae bacterium]
MDKERLNILGDKFCALFGGDKSDIRYFAAPGRVNLIGEHIDYCGGFVFPAALTLDNVIAVRKTNDRKLTMAATDLEGIYVADLDDIDKAQELKWGDYQAGVAKELMAKGVELSGCQMLMDGTIPYGSGLSSSASIELVTAVALSALAGDKTIDQPEKLIEMALVGQAAEHNFCNVNCGIMDQFASAMGKKDNAILLNCGTLEYKYVPLNLGDYVLVLANTCKKHSLGSSKYNERRGEVDKGLEILKAACPKEVENLCDYTEEDFNQYGNAITDPVIYNRVKHVILENERVKKAVAILEAGDLEAFGKILCEANDSIRYLYEVTGDELDAMWEEARKIPGCLGSRMTGAGFGGCVLNIVKKDVVDEFVTTVGKNYEARTGIKPEFYICQIGDGAREV